MSLPNKPWLRFAFAAGLFLATGLFLYSRSQPENLPARNDLDSFPRKLGGWVVGRDITITQDVRDILGAGEFLQRIYVRGYNEPSVDLFLAFFPSQRAGSAIHTPQNCLPGSGWTPISHSRIELARPGGGTITVNRYLIGKGMDRLVVLYWYQAHGRVVASEYWAKFYLVADSIRLNRSDGAMVRLITAVAPGETPEDAERRVVDFSSQILPVLSGYIPD